MLAALDDEAVLAIYADASRPSADRQQAFEELVRRFSRRLFAVCVRVLGSAQDAEETVQEVFIRLARHADTFRGESKLSTWLYRVARNAATDRVRHEARRPATPVDDLSTLPEAPVAEDAVAMQDTASAIGQALAQLGDDTRMMVLLVAVDGWSYQQVADAVDLPVGTVKSRVSRARVRLGQLLAEPADDDGGHAHDGMTRPLGSRPSDPIRPRGPPVP